MKLFLNAIVPVILWNVIASSNLFGETILVPEDERSIQKAIDRSKPGDIIEVSPGLYEESITLKKGVTLRSAGDNKPGTLGLRRAELTIIDCKNKTNASGVTLAQGSILDGFTIRNVGAYDDKKWNLHHKTQGNNQPHEHIGRPSIAGVHAKGVSCTVLYNIVHHNGYSGIVVDGMDKIETSPTISGNVCFRNMGAGISLMNRATAQVSRNKCFENFYAGIGQNNASSHLFDNDCYSNIRAGIGISNGSCPLVERNRCYKNRRAGIGSRSGKKTIPFISRNECFENDMAGIGCEEDAAPVIVANNCFRNKLAGIGCRLHASPTIIGNKCYANEMAGIGNDSDSRPLIVSNHCYENKTAGIGFAKCSDGKALVLNNRLIENKLVAMGVHPGWRIQALGNHLERKSGMPPLVMVFKGSAVDFVDNTLVGGGVAGIRCAGKVRIELCKIVGNQFRKTGPPNFGVWGLPGSNIEIMESNFSSWRHAVSAQTTKLSVAESRVLGGHQFAFVINDPVSGSQLTNNLVISHSKELKLLKTQNRDSIVVRSNVIKVKESSNE